MRKFLETGARKPERPEKESTKSSDRSANLMKIDNSKFLNEKINKESNKTRALLVVDYLLNQSCKPKVDLIA
jgi:hypothetical protein